MTMTDKLLATLKRHNPSKVVVYTSDDDATAISVPGGRKKWSQVVATIETKFKSTWSRVELLDKGGALVATVDNTAPAEDLEDIGGGRGVPAQVERLLGIVIKAQRDAIVLRNEQDREAYKALQEVVRVLTDSVRNLGTLHNAQLEAERELARIRAESMPEPDQMQQFLDAMPAIVQLAPMVKQFIGGGGVSTPKNGVK